MPHLSPLLAILLTIGSLPAVYGVEHGSSEVTGDLDAHAPFGMPPEAFRDWTSEPNASASFSIIGYNVSVPAGGDPNGNENMIEGWTMSSAVAADVPLKEALGLPVSDRSKFTDATVLSITPPEGVEVDSKSWKLCAVVYPGLSREHAASKEKLNGTCDAILPSDCMKQLQIAAVVGAIDKDGACSSPDVPARCQDQFPDNGTAFALTSSVVSANRFYAFGTPPMPSGNSTALEEATHKSWPVLITWAHLAADGNFQAITAYFQCVNAAKSPSTGGDDGASPSEGAPSPTPSAGTSDMGVGSRWAFAVAIAMAVWLW